MTRYLLYIYISANMIKSDAYWMTENTPTYLIKKIIVNYYNVTSVTFVGEMDFRIKKNITKNLKYGVRHQPMDINFIKNRQT